MLVSLACLLDSRCENANPTFATCRVTVQQQLHMSHWWDTSVHITLFINDLAATRKSLASSSINIIWDLLFCPMTYMITRQPPSQTTMGLLVSTRREMRIPECWWLRSMDIFFLSSFQVLLLPSSWSSWSLFQVVVRNQGGASTTRKTPWESCYRGVSREVQTRREKWWGKHMHKRGHLYRSGIIRGVCEVGPPQAPMKNFKILFLTVPK